MAHILDSASFIDEMDRIPRCPEGRAMLDALLERCLRSDGDLRNAFRARLDYHRQVDPLVSLVDIFEAPQSLRRTFSRPLGSISDPADRHVMPLSAGNRRKDGSPSLIDSLPSFERNFAIFTEGSLSRIRSWENMIVAGGAIQACMAPLPDHIGTSNTRLREYYHKEKYPSSDIDIFLHGLSKKQAIEKILEIHDAVQSVVPVRIKCVATKRAITLYSIFPFRPVQIILGLHQSPADVLTGFDIDSCACLYNGARPFMSPRSIIAAMQQANTVDMSRRSGQYEYRLVKYAMRGFEIQVPNLDRERLDPALYCHSLKVAKGLSRLLLLERIFGETDSSASSDRGRIEFLDSRNRYGPGWSEECSKEISESQENGKGGDMSTVIENISFLERESQPGISRLDSHELSIWSAQVHIEDALLFLTAVSTHNATLAHKLIERQGFINDYRDGEGRTALHLAILTKAEDIARMLIDHDYRISTCLPDGRNSLHLAAQMDMPDIIERLLEQSEANRSPTRNDALAAYKCCRCSTSSGPDSAGGSTSTQAPGHFVEARYGHQVDQDTDAFAVDLPDGEGYTALCYAMVSGSDQGIQALLRAKAKIERVKLGSKTQLYSVPLQRPHGSQESASTEDSAIIDFRGKRGWIVRGRDLEKIDYKYGEQVASGNRVDEETVATREEEDHSVKIPEPPSESESEREGNCVIA